MRRYPLVSILIPLYNAEQHFSNTLESLLAQTYKNIEIIIVDDGSTDKSLYIAKEYESKYKYLKVFTQKNSGAQIARNKAFELSKGEYIQYFDADDIMHPDKIMSQMKALSRYDFKDSVIASGTWLTFVNSIDDAICKDQIINKNYENKFLFFKDAWENREYIIGQSWLIPRRINEKTGDWNINLIKNQDGEFFTRVVYNSDKIIYVKESIVYWQKGITNSTSSNNSLAAMRAQLDSYNIYYNLVKTDLNKYSLCKGIAKLYSSFYMANFPLDKEMKKEVYTKLKSLGYNHPIIEIQSKYLWINKLFSVDTILYMKRIKSKFLSILLKTILIEKFNLIKTKYKLAQERK